MSKMHFNGTRNIVRGAICGESVVYVSGNTERVSKTKTRCRVRQKDPQCSDVAGARWAKALLEIVTKMPHGNKVFSFFS